MRISICAEQTCAEYLRRSDASYDAGATSRTQWPNVPKVTEECRASDELVRVTLRIPMSPMTGAEIVVIKRSIADINIIATPM
jgi:hypothetical protein